MIRPEGTPHNDADEKRTLRLDPYPVTENADQWARRQYMNRVLSLTAQLSDLKAGAPTVCDMRSIGWEIIADAIRGDHWDMHAFVGAVSCGVVEGMRQMGVMVGE